MRKYLLAALAALAIPVALAATVPTAAQAGIMDRLNAADEVERQAGDRYGIDAISSCRQLSSRSFTCTIFDYKGDCSYSGRAGVYKRSYYTYRVTSMRVSKSCF